MRLSKYRTTPEQKRRFYQLPFSTGPELDGLAAEAFATGVDAAGAAGGSGAIGDGGSRAASAR